MKKLAKPLGSIQPEYDYVVIGSGYGGSISASRMARSGQSVCLFEKGKEFLPGEFPDSLLDASKEMNFIKGKSTSLEKNGLYEFTIGNGINVFKGCGLGGTSLVNANVSIKPEKRVMQDEMWPLALRQDLASFEEGVNRAWEMLKPNPYPENKNGYPVLKKTEAMRKSADFMSAPFGLLDINVNFENKINHVGIKQPKCTNCGDCVTGCNVGAKNTTAMNYLPDAFNHGADIFTSINVRYVKKFKSHWQVYYHPIGIGRDNFDAPLMFVRAKNVVLSAGSLGSTEILFRSAKKGLKVSQRLGMRFTGNGDVLGFGYNNDERINGIGLGKKGTDQIANVGPCITSIIDLREREDLASGMTLEEGTVPGPIRSLMPKALIAFSRLVGKDTDRGIKDYFKEKLREFRSLFLGAFHGAVAHTQIYLVMTHDDGNGVMKMDDEGKLNLSWEGVGKQEIFKKVSGEIFSATQALGGTKIPNPTWNNLMNYDLVTVHPLGGCGMGESIESGVVDHKGQVFSGESDTALHEGLFVLDGAIIPRPVGTNPLLTISALTERSCKLIAEEKGYDLNYDLVSPSNSVGNEFTGTGVQFTETMKGFIGIGEMEDFEKGFAKGKLENTTFEFTLTIQTEDIDAFISNEKHAGKMVGSMSAPSVCQEALSAYNGDFNLFIQDEGDSERKRMNYTSALISPEGGNYYFEGFKDIYNDRVVDAWKDTTTLFITLYEGDSPAGNIVGKGKLVIKVSDLLKQLGTVKAIHPKSKEEGRKAIGSFGKFFAGNVFETYFKP
ncbi:GMC family oxidoreductase N-terminal domain-containing protein [Cyclobacterium marinum]|uniref:GMC family oxidoreductase N-terminal domain-containing protein n=1 Tax=Cyclobacterium marinum TaxID=104 RepID=UPI0011EBBE9A|nr:GMC family oxidoreductase N-terminal domain-containing protein [Cyclobacterium marinum]MBI0397850.1 GMC family oxidoreductase [Cyclobacterium marinum]